MVKNAPFEPRWASAPGETISDRLHRHNLSLISFAQRMGSSPEKVNQLLSGEAKIDHDLAERLHRAIGGSARFWLNRDAQYRDDLRRLNVEHDRKAVKDWIQELPLHDMIKFAWIKHTSDKLDQAAECLRFFNSPNVDSWRNSYKSISDVVAFRTSDTFKSRPVLPLHGFARVK